MATPGALWQALVDQVYRYVLGPAGLTGADVAWFFDRIIPFFIILGLFLLAARILVWVLDHTIFSGGRVDPMIAQLVDRLLSVLVMFIGFSVALLVFHVNIFSLALTLGLVGAALALGFQNTVANIMGGIALVTDRPFEVGDRVQVGEFWGDVEDIGLRSTRILTARREYVVIPNRLMDEREIWNYTKRYPELRIDVPMSISYDSDRRLARALMLQAAREHTSVLAFPRPEVLVRAHGDNGVHMELWCYIGEARQRYRVESELLARCQDLFEENGVEIPWPYRTLVYKKDMPAPQRAGPGRSLTRAELRPRRLLVATAGATPALNKAQTIISMAKDLEADVVVSYIVPRTSLVSQREGERAADIFSAAAKRAGVSVKLRVEEGQVIDAIGRVVRQESCGAVVIGAPRSPVLLAWNRANVAERLRDALDVPVVVVPPSQEIDPEEVAAARASLDSIAPLADAQATDDEGAAPP
ncbi:MAG: mechanosensitive ion channel [Candidatus Thermoplasmatota archaeon]|nr:mechanosensitive ion channel [Candidatus Thermoplasmatota archaeon]